MIRVDIPEYNTSVEFPDNMNQQEMEGILSKNFPSKEKGFVDTYMPYLKTAGDTFIKEITEGTGVIKQAYNEPTARNIGKALLGAAQLAFSPLTATAKGYVGEPVEKAIAGTAEAIGIEEPTLPLYGGKPSKLIGEMAEQAVPMGGYGKIVKGAILAKEAPGLATMGKAAQAIKVGESILKQPLKYAREPSPEMAAKFIAENKLNKPIIQEGIQETVSKNAIGVFEDLLEQKKVAQQLTDMAKKAGYEEKVIPGILEKHGINTESIKIIEDESKRVGQKIIDLLHKNEINFQGVPEILTKYGISPQEFAQELKNTYSTAGRTLQRLSYTAKQLKKTFEEGSEVGKFIDDFVKEMPEETFGDKVFNAVYGLEQRRRALLVTQVATTARNIISQGARVGIGSVEDAVEGSIKATIGGEGNLAEQAGRGLDLLTATLGRMSPSQRARLANIIEQNQESLTKLRLFAPAVYETTIGGKAVTWLNKLNQTQEYFFRKLAFQSKLGQMLKEKGSSLDIDPKQIPMGMLEKATDYALEMTFAAMPKGKMAAEMVRSWSKNPIATVLINPFPRFAFGNALPFLVNYSPYGFLKMLAPKTVAELASGNPDKFAKAATQATIGTSMLGWAMNYRKNADQDSKWYEIKVGDKYIDTRAFAPISSYLFLAESLTNPERVKGGDVASALIGLNRIAGTGLVFTDLIRGKKMDLAVDTLSKLGGEILGSFSVPFRTPKDIISGFDKKEGKIRDTSGEGILAPTMRNIPFLSQTLPEAKSPVTTKPLETEYPIVRQTTGLSIKTKSIMDKEIDRLNIDRGTLYAKSGLPEVDRMISGKMAPIVEKYGEKIINSPVYKNLSPTMQEAFLTQKLIKPARELAKKELIKENPQLGIILKYEGQPDLMKRLLKEYGISLDKSKSRKIAEEIEQGGNQ